MGLLGWLTLIPLIGLGYIALRILLLVRETRRHHAISNAGEEKSHSEGDDDKSSSKVWSDSVMNSNGAGSSVELMQQIAQLDGNFDQASKELVKYGKEELIIGIAAYIHSGHEE